MKFKNLFIVFLTLISFTAQAQVYSIRLNYDEDADDLFIKATTDNNYLLNADKPAGDGTSESGAPKVYIPVLRTIGTESSADYYLDRLTNKTNELVFDITRENHFVQFPLKVTTLNDDRWIYVAVKDPSDSKYKIVKRYNTQALPLNQTLGLEFPVSPAEICEQVETDCDSLKLGTSGVVKSYSLYFFFKDTYNFGLGDEVTPSGTTGLFFQANLSNRPPSQVSFQINNVNKGDKRILVDFISSSSVQNVKHIKVISRNSNDPNNTPIVNVTGELLPKNFAYTQEGKLTINDLENNTQYNLSIVAVDKYNFVSLVSPSFDAVPMQIEELLKQNQCFLLTAGFGEDHYVIDYFRHLRDSYLKKTILGQAFIDFYYEHGPKLALKIYKDEDLRMYVRTVAYIMYYFLLNLPLLLAILVIYASFSVDSKKSLKRSKFFV